MEGGGGEPKTEACQILQTAKFAVCKRKPEKKRSEHQVLQASLARVKVNVAEHRVRYSKIRKNIPLTYILQMFVNLINFFMCPGSNLLQQ